MTFALKGLGNVLAILGNASGASGGRNVAHTYITNDTMAEVLASDYFLTNHKNLTKGDIILVVVDMGGTPDFDFVQVTEASATTVTVSRKGLAVVGDQGNVAALTGALTGAIDGSLSDVGATNGSDVSAAINKNFKELQTTQAAILDALAASGLMVGP